MKMRKLATVLVLVLAVSMMLVAFAGCANTKPKDILDYIENLKANSNFTATNHIANSTMKYDGNKIENIEEGQHIIWQVDGNNVKHYSKNASGDWSTWDGELSPGIPTAKAFILDSFGKLSIDNIQYDKKTRRFDIVGENDMSLELEDNVLKIYHEGKFVGEIKDVGTTSITLPDANNIK